MCFAHLLQCEAVRTGVPGIMPFMLPVVTWYRILANLLLQP